MADRTACQRRVYRLALLLTGDREAAMNVVQHVVDAQPDLDQIDSAHLDRLTVLRSREHASAEYQLNGVPDDIAAALRDMPAQHREAWIFARMYRLPLREMARAMDCSTTAVARHLDLADTAMRERLGRDNAHQAAGQLLKHSMTLDIPSHFAARWKRARLVRRFIRMLIVLLLLAIIVAAVFVLVDLFGDEMADWIDRLFETLDPSEERQ